MGLVNQGRVFRQNTLAGRDGLVILAVVETSSGEEVVRQCAVYVVERCQISRDYCGVAFSGTVLSCREICSGDLKLIDDPFPGLLGCHWSHRSVVGVFGVDRHALLFASTVFVRLAEALHKLEVTVGAESLGLCRVSLHGRKGVRGSRHLISKICRSLVRLSDGVA